LHPPAPPTRPANPAPTSPAKPPAPPSPANRQRRAPSPSAELNRTVLLAAQADREAGGGPGQVAAVQVGGGADAQLAERGGGQARRVALRAHDDDPQVVAGLRQ